MSETYTAVYEKDGDIWLAKITEESRVQSRGASLAEARQTVRDALAQWLKTDPAELRIVDDFRLPTTIRTAQQEVRATRTESDRAKMMAGMTDSKSAMSWAEELGISLRDPMTVQCLEGLGDREISIDTFCHTITMAEDMARWTRTDDSVSPDGARQEGP